MTGKLDVYNAYFNAAWANPPASLAEAGQTYLADDFQNLDSDGKVLMDRATFIGMAQLLVSAFQDFKFVVADVNEVEDGAVVKGHFEGTHTADLDLSALGVGVVPASGKKIVWPEATEKFAIEGDKITSAQAVGGGGIADFLAALGVKMPSA